MHRLKHTLSCRQVFIVLAFCIKLQLFVDISMKMRRLCVKVFLCVCVVWECVPDRYRIWIIIHMH